MRRFGSARKLESTSETEGEPIEIVRLADVLSDRGIARVHLWKLDVEGYEFRPCEGQGSGWRTKESRRSEAELAGENGVQVRAFLEGHGYKCHVFSRTGNSSPRPCCRNIPMVSSLARR